MAENPSVSLDVQGDKAEESEKLSKSQLKKRLQREKWLKYKDEKRKLEKERRKIKRQLESQKREENGETGPVVRRAPYMLMSESKNKFRVVIDMDFEDYMTDMEITKAVSQVGRIYAINRRSGNPCQLYVTSLKGKILDKFATTNTGYLSWDINRSDQNYVSLFVAEEKSEDSCPAITKNNFVYLSGDADDTLPEVDDILKDESKIYVIGGLVDHNRHKNLCHKLAQEKGIKTAKLPIKENIQMTQRHILSTVAAFEIMLHVLGGHKTWPEALLASIPKRKVAPQSATDKADADDGNKPNDNLLETDNATGCKKQMDTNREDFSDLIDDKVN